MDSGNIADKMRAIASRVITWIRPQKVVPYEELIYKKDQLSNRLDAIYSDLSKLQDAEQQLLTSGKSASLLSAKKRTASEIARCRSEMKYVETMARMVTAQINVIGVELHNRAIIEQNKIVELPNLDEITMSTVNAEEVLDSLSEASDAVEKCHATFRDPSRDELDILKELSEQPQIVNPVKQDQIPTKAWDYPTTIAAFKPVEA